MRVEKTNIYTEWIDAPKNGDKSSQHKDIAKAIQLARTFQE